METIDILWPVIAAGLIVPTAKWLRRIVPTDFPIQSVLFVSALCVGVTWLLSQWLAPEMTWPDIINYAAKTQVVSQLMHAGMKMKGG